MRLIVEADGGSRGNPGPAGFGAVVKDSADGAIVREVHGYLGTATNNVAEYRGVIAGLTAALELGATEADVRMDSKLVVEQLSGRWRVKHPDMVPLAREAAALLARFTATTLQWIPRAQNADADRMANLAMDEGTGRVRSGATRIAATDPDVGTDVVAPASWTPPGTPVTRLLLARHGSTAHSAEHRMSGRNDLPLNAAGRAQADALAARLAAEFADDPPLLVTSPVARARETAGVVAAALGRDPVVDDDLAELDFGDWEGLTPAELEERWPAQVRAWSAPAGPDARPPGGESIGELQRRVRRARQRIVTAQPAGAVVVVSHVTPIKALAVGAIGAPPAAMMRMYLTPGSLTELWFGDAGSQSLRSFNDRGHLAHLPDY